MARDAVLRWRPGHLFCITTVYIHSEVDDVDDRLQAKMCETLLLRRHRASAPSASLASKPLVPFEDLHFR